MDPYEILGIPRDADDDAVRKAYLDLIRRYSPDRHPEEFKRIGAAYETLKDERSRLRYLVLDTDTPGDTPFQVFLRHAAARGKRKPPKYETFKDFLRRCAKN